MNRLQIHTKNCPEDTPALSEFKSQLGHALSEGPSDSSLCCCFAKEGDLYVLNLRVHSSHGHFPLHLTHKSSRQLIQNALAEIKKQFRTWHDNPVKYGDEHSMGAQACTHGDGTVLQCPIHSPANKSFEDSTGG